MPQILTVRQANRLKKLFDPLMDYLSRLPSIKEAHRRMGRSDETPLEEVLFRAIWGTEGDPSPIDDQLDTIATMVDFRGVVSLDEALTALIELTGYQISDELDLLIEALAEHLNRGALPFQVLTLRWPRGEYCVSADLVGDTYLELMAPAPNPDRILAILDARRTIPPRDTAGAQAPASVLELVRTRPSYRKLCRFLDAHVPQGHDRATYAGDVADAIVLGIRSAMDNREVRALIDTCGRALAKAHLKRYQELAQDLARDTPRWANNGWAPNEL